MASCESHTEYTIDPILPPNEVDEIDDMHPVLSAQQQAEALANGSEVRCVDDPEIGQPAVDVVEQGMLQFPCNSILRYLVLHIKNLEKFTSLDVEIVDDAKLYRAFHLSSRRTIATITPEQCELPMMLGSGWQVIHLDLEDMVRRAYGTGYLSTVQVTINGTCRVAKAFFSDVIYADAQLPPFLRVVGEEESKEF